MFEPLVRRGRLWAAAGLILLGLAVPFASQAAEFADAVNRLGSDSFSEKSSAIDEVSASGQPRAVEILAAMKEGRLYVRLADNVVLIGEQAGGAIKAVVAATGEDLGPLAADAASQIVVNNRLRAKLESASSRQSVITGDAAGRRKAAEALLKSPSPAAVPMLRDALAKETDAAAKAALGLALAAAELSDPEPARRLAALAAFAETSDPQVKNLIQARLSLESDEAIRAALGDALQRIEKRLALYNIALNLFQGISLGSVLLLAA
ncbi:MAG: urea ABC transporter permease subunit UrtB, partial [Pseudomonadota bacterium]